jgi:hypothetical protein
VRAGVTVDDLLALVAAVVWAGQQAPDPSDQAERLLSIMMYGPAATSPGAG